MAFHRPLGRPGLPAGSRKNALLLLAVLLCCQSFTQHAAAREMARTLQLEAAAGQTAPAQSAAGKPQPQQAPKQQPTAAPPAAAAASSDAQQQTWLAASRQARAAAQGRKQPGAPLPVSAPPTTAAAKREAWKAAFRARQAAGKAAAAAAEEMRPHPQVVEDLPELIPLPLLFGQPKYTNPQLSRDGKFLAYIKPAPQTGVSNVFIRRLPQQTTAAAAAAAAAAPAARSSSSSPSAAAQPRTAFESSARSLDAARLAVQQRSSIFEREGTDDDQQITFDLIQGVSSYSWTEDSSSILYIQDSNGDENYHLYLVPINKPGEAIDLTPFPGVKAQDIVCSELHPDKLFIGLNKRDPNIFDLYLLDMPTLTLSLHTVNPGEINNWLMDYDFKIRGAEGYDNSNGASYVLVDDNMPLVAPEKRTKAWRTHKLAALRKSAGQKPVPAQANFKPLEALFVRAQKEGWGTQEWVAASSSKSDVSSWRRHMTWPFGEEGGVFKFTVAGDAMYVISSLGRDTTELQLVSAAPGAKVLKRIASHPLANVNSVEFNPETYEPQIVSFNYLTVQWTLLDASLAEEWGRIEALRPGEEVTIVDRSSDEKVWILAYTSDSVNSKYYLHRRGSWPPELLINTQPALLDYSVAKTHPVVIPARDGLLLPSYLTLPVKGSIPTSLPECVTGPLPDLSGRGGPVRAAAQRSSSSSEDGNSICPLGLDLPLVLYVHGGPWSRDTWGADPVVQLLTNRGYAVLQVNYRASSGYGKRFMNLGNKQWGVGTMQHDLTDSVKWAIEKGIADPKKVCIKGGSYGGYATLAGLAFTPELYACGIDLVGISNVGTFMRSIPPYWKPLQYEWTTRVGPADVDEALNRRISPLYHVHQIKAPLLIAQGAHDPRVPQAESDQMFRAMHTKGRPVQYVLYTDEGHGMSKPQNRKDYYSRVEQFLARYLGGRGAPPLRGLEGVSAIEVKNLADLATVADFANRHAADLPVALVKAADSKPATVAKAASTSAAPTP